MIISDYGLLIPRGQIKFKIVPGTFETLPGQPDVISGALVKTRGDYYDSEGMRSGERSGLLRLNGHILKIKGCDIEKAFELGFYCMNAGEPIPNGGQFLQSARNELMWLGRFNELIGKEFPIVQEPYGIINYAVHFAGPPYGEMPLAASVMKVKGDTRLVELLEQDVRDEAAASELYYSLGMMAGAQKRMTKNMFMWGLGNCHLGNYLVYADNGNLHLMMTDFDGSSAPGGLVNNRWMDNLLSRMEKYNEAVKLTKGFWRNVDIPKHISKAFVGGFREGYTKPDSRKCIPLELLCQAYDLSTMRPVVSGYC